MALDLAFEAVGDGPPLLILHGLFGSGSNWRRIARELAGSHRVISVDLRNHGASPWADSMNYLQMAGDVRLLIARLGLTRPSIIGHSMGGKVAMAMALMYPHHVDRLVVVDIAPVAYADRLSAIPAAMHAVVASHAASREEVRQRLTESLSDAALVAFLMQNLVVRNAHFDWRVNVAAIASSLLQLADFPVRLRTQAFDGPVHVIAGGGSDYVTRHDGAEFKAMFPLAQVEVIERAGHWVHADQPEAFVTAVRQALQGTDLAMAD